MSAVQTVIDTNVFLSGLRSSQGASHKLLRELGQNPRLQIHVSVPLILEYEDVTKRQARLLGLTFQDIDDILDYLCSTASRHQIFYLWRPFLPDPKDDMLLELAVEAQCSYIVTFNTKDFLGIEQFGLKAVTPQQLLKLIGTLP
ncbi:MAG: putative toxin-antitoxin system toxin component, PIN family [Bythopirellula sp.]|nr:putative toxin-antitoxin system toxin component, PIN family [Bythopirellula sp.]